MPDCTLNNPTPAPQSASLNDLERLWGDPGQSLFADEAWREQLLERGSPLPPPPPPPTPPAVWHQPLCA
ncbi:MAG: hypothetical protein HGA65_02490 [Oscillochloris sp.]|nr:hypothetical protein [Oscillochloris sp.]